MHPLAAAATAIDLDTAVADGGGNLSGGQRQLLDSVHAAAASAPLHAGDYRAPSADGDGLRPHPGDGGRAGGGERTAGGAVAAVEFALCASGAGAAFIVAGGTRRVEDGARGTGV
eukprot:ctg_740.g175